MEDDTDDGAQPALAEAWFGCGIARRLMSAFASAADAFGKAIEHHYAPLTLAYYQRGSSWSERAQQMLQAKEKVPPEVLQKAVDDLDRAIDINAGYVAAYKARADAFRSAGRFEPAMKDYLHCASRGFCKAECEERMKALRGMRTYWLGSQDLIRAELRSTRHTRMLLARDAIKPDQTSDEEDAGASDVEEKEETAGKGSGGEGKDAEGAEEDQGPGQEGAADRGEAKEETRVAFREGQELENVREITPRGEESRANQGGIEVIADDAETAEATRINEALGTFQISRDTIKAATKKFSAADADKSGEIDFQEFCSALAIEPAEPARKLFALFDRDASGTIDAPEFLSGREC